MDNDFDTSISFSFLLVILTVKPAPGSVSSGIAIQRFVFERAPEGISGHGLVGAQVQTGSREMHKVAELSGTKSLANTACTQY